MAAGWGEGTRATFSPRTDWTPHRYGANLPETLILLRDGVQRAVYAAMGVPADLMSLPSRGRKRGKLGAGSCTEALRWLAPS